MRTAEDGGLDAAQRRRLREACRAAGIAVERIEALPGGLSRRRFARVHTGGSPPTLVARLEAEEDPAGRPAGAAPEPPHEPIRALLETAGLPVPRRLGGDAPAGVELLEDVGSLPLCDAAATADPATRRTLYAEACAWLPRLQGIGPAPGVAAFARRLDAELIAYKAGLLLDEGLPLRGRPASRAEAESLRAAFARIARELGAAPARLAHRDYQSANLFVDLRAPAGRRLRMIDVQGAFLAPPEYDAVCLLCDSYVALPDAEIAAHADSLRPALPDAPDAESFARRFDWLTLTRKGKDYARFAYAARRSGDRDLLRFLPVTRRHLRRAARRAASRDAWIAPLAELIDTLPEQPGSPCAR